MMRVDSFLTRCRVGESTIAPIARSPICAPYSGEHKDYHAQEAAPVRDDYAQKTVRGICGAHGRHKTAEVRNVRRNQSLGVRGEWEGRK